MALSITLFEPVLAYSHTIKFSDGSTCDTLSIAGRTVDGERLRVSLDLHNLPAHVQKIFHQLSDPKDLTDITEPAPATVRDEIPF